MILTSDGQVLTNNHVVDQSTSIKVSIAGPVRHVHGPRGRCRPDG